MPSAPPLPDVTIETPYTAGKRNHETLYGDLALRARNWRLACFALLALALVVSTDNLLGRLSVTHIVHILEVLPDGTVLRVTTADPIFRPKEAYIKAQLKTFVRDLRGRIKDPVVTRERWTDLTAHVTHKGHTRLRHDYSESKPLEYKGSLQVTISSVLPMGGSTYQVRWEETSYNEHNVRIETIRYIGSFTLVIRPPSTHSEVETNPMGIWVDSWHISQDTV